MQSASHNVWSACLHDRREFMLSPASNSKRAKDVRCIETSLAVGFQNEVFIGLVDPGAQGGCELTRQHPVRQNERSNT